MEYKSKTDAVGWTDETRLRKISNYLSGPALSWYELGRSTRSLPSTWSEMERGLLIMYGSSQQRIDNQLNLLRQRQDEDVSAYIDRSIQLCNRRALTIDDVLARLTNGLIPETRSRFRSVPRGVKNMFSFEAICEEIQYELLCHENKMEDMIVKESEAQSQLNRFSSNTVYQESAGVSSMANHVIQQPSMRQNISMGMSMAVTSQIMPPQQMQPTSEYAEILKCLQAITHVLIQIQDRRDRTRVECHYCHKLGHIRRDCRKIK